MNSYDVKIMETGHGFRASVSSRNGGMFTASDQTLEQTAIDVGSFVAADIIANPNGPSNGPRVIDFRKEEAQRMSVRDKLAAAFATMNAVNLSEEDK
jgi:hypothetical protein